MAMITGTRISRMLTADTIIGDKVVNKSGEKLGDVKDLALDLEKGCVTYAVLDFGGFLGIGDKYFAVPWDAFTIDEDNRQLVLDVSKEKLQSAPGFDKNDWPDFTDASWMQQTNAFYGVGPSGGMGGGMGGGTRGY